MKNYISPDLQIEQVEKADIITSSSGKETGRYEESDGIWDLNIN